MLEHETTRLPHKISVAPRNLMVENALDYFRPMIYKYKDTKYNPINVCVLRQIILSLFSTENLMWLTHRILNIFHTDSYFES